ncbi:MAG: thymidine kinase [Erysipelotrichaceae bacterium]|nr:thymidine kinase [Erysipelotrichaceae bacterium]
MYHLYNKGWIEVICGSMFAGKSEELIRRVNTLLFAKQNVVIFKPAIDNRYSEDEVATHNGNKIKCYSISEANDIYKYVKDNTNAVAIDEVQFFGPEIVDICNDLADKGIRVIVAGLDMDYKGKPFGPMPYLLATAEFVTKLTAVCTKCGAPATRSEKIDMSSTDIVDVAAAEKYTARCRRCHTKGRD